MSKFDNPDELWGDGGDLADAGAAKIDLGWESGEKPQHDWMNYWMHRADRNFQSLNKQGVLEWDAVTNYPADAIVWHGNTAYISVAGGNVNNTPSSTSVFWQKLKMPSVVVGATQPVNGQVGNVWLNTTEGVIYICTVAYPTNTWTKSGDTVSVQSSAPASPATGKLWYDTTASVLAMKVWNGAAWVFVDHGAIAHVGTTPPSNPVQGSLWWSSANGKMFIYFDDGTSQQWVACTPMPSTQPINEILHVQDQKANATDGGAFTSGAYRTRDLNTVLNNDISGASLAANQISLDAGKYEFHASAVHSGVGVTKLRLRDVTNGTNLGGESLNGDNGTEVDEIRGVFTLAGTVLIELQHICQSTGGTGFGTHSSVGSPEIYADVFIRKIQN